MDSSRSPQRVYHRALEDWERGTRQTDPPLKAPTGFLAGNGVASASLRVDVWKLRVVRRAAEGVEMARMAGDRMREVIVVCEVEIVSFGCRI